MLRYSIRVWKRWLADDRDTGLLPPILPLVLYHGEGRWTAAIELTELFDIDGFSQDGRKALLPYLPRLRIMLQSLGVIDDDKLPRTPAVRLTLLLFKHGKRPELLQSLKVWIDDLRRLVDQGEVGLRHLAQLVQYILLVNEEVTREGLKEVLDTLGSEAGETAMTEGERLIEEGRRQGIQQGVQQGVKQGIQQGLQRGRREGMSTLVRRLLSKGMSVDEVAELTELTVDEVRDLAR